MGVTVLIADDSEDSRWLVTVLLRHEAAVDAVLQAKNGAEAIEVVRRERPQVVILDYMMPRLDGLQATRLIICPDPEAQARSTRR